MKPFVRLALLPIAAAPALAAQVDWPTYGHDKGAQRYSPLTQINVSNVAHLSLAWRFDMRSVAAEVGPVESIPIVGSRAGLHGRLRTTRTASRRCH